jgi:hypothetical protein
MSFFHRLTSVPKKYKPTLLSNLAVKTNINKIISGFLGSKFFETHTVVSVAYTILHGLQTTNEVFFHLIFKLLGLDRWILGHLGRLFSADSSAPILVTVSPLSMFSINQPLFLQFLQKTKPLYLFGIGIWIWAAKNLRVNRRISVVRAPPLATEKSPTQVCVFL